jgi:phosphatidylethanolamine/phosphatidyl-N-methylethanolamine N-methyltransferase
MKFPWQDHFTFFSQFRQRFETTGAIAPSSRFLASAMTGPLRRRERPARILEVGPGTGAVTRTIVRQLGSDDTFDLVEINETFADLLKQRFERDVNYNRVAGISRVHVCPLQEFQTEGNYDYIISGLPLNNFSPELVGQFFEVFFRLLAPGGVLSYFEYMYVRAVRKRVSKESERTRLRALDDVIGPYLAEHRFRRNWVFANVPPAWVQHLRKP